MIQALHADRPRFTEAMADVGKFFEKPEAVLVDRDFDRDQKIELLKQWDADLRSLMVAADENMAPEGADRTGDQLRQVQAALSCLGVGDSGEGAPTKTGGKS
ncbi:hypothetical protein EDC65_4759 [Stella humosa]|uniref:Uncharacterized protein n=1 Tax=Stella humosa TaxID=94 RepID=A0A3N1KYE6_9PROT|nr:hypothetical protein [Stella humosa]ROP83226.1 hypothetical protein EDC65_4759 [Stella humosa]BBK29993.1 hypothetical protein STHU_06270 [Stella humosa]